jgi:Fur family transcriptional regulator, ferric uptake regulator
MMENEDTIYNWLEKKGVRLTSNREDILEILLEEGHKHLSAADIYDLLRNRNKSMGLATIYRTLDLLTKIGILAKRDFDSETSRYELVINQGTHHHLICKNCGKVIEIPDLLPDDIKKKLLKENGFLCLDYNIKFYGYCKECREKMINE